MKQTVNNSDFHDAFHKAGRDSQFSYEALNLLFDYFEEVESDCGQEIELDVIAICCDYTEMTIFEVLQNYDIDLDGVHPDRVESKVLDFLNDNTTVVGLNGESIVFANF